MASFSSWLVPSPVTRSSVMDGIKVYGSGVAAKMSGTINKHKQKLLKMKTHV